MEHLQEARCVTACYWAQAVKRNIEMGMAALAFGTSAHVATETLSE